MLPIRIAACSLLLLLAVGGCSKKAAVTPERFQELVDTPGDNVPLSHRVDIGVPLWTNAEINLVLNYASGRVVTEKMQGTAKTIAGKYIVHTVQSELHHQPMHSIFTYDEKSGEFKEYGLFSNKVTEATLTFDTKAKTFAAKASFGTGFTETSTGSYSDVGESSHTVVRLNGEYFMTRDETTRPVSSGN